jgi:hypothetical protein
MSTALNNKSRREGETMKQTLRRLIGEFDSINGRGAAAKFIEGFRVERKMKFLNQAGTIAALRTAIQTTKTKPAPPQSLPAASTASTGPTVDNTDVSAVDLIEAYIALEDQKKREDFRTAHSATLRKSCFANSLAYWAIQSGRPLTWNERSGFFFTASEIRRRAIKP